MLHCTLKKSRIWLNANQEFVVANKEFVFYAKLNILDFETMVHSLYIRTN